MAPRSTLDELQPTAKQGRAPQTLSEITAGASVAERIRAAMPTLTAAKARVARAVLAEPVRVLRMSVSDLASEAETSVATVVRCCQDLDFTGFQDLKIALARESASDEQQLLDDVRPDDSAAEVLTKVTRSTADAISALATNVDTQILDTVANALVNARQILFIAVGTSAPLAADTAYRLTTTGLHATAHSDVHLQHVTARLLAPGDVCVAISHTGSTHETLAGTRAAAAAGATTVAVTSFTRSPLTEIVDHSLIAGSRETSYRVEAMTSRLAHLAVLDALFVLVTLRRPEESRAALATTGDVLSEHRF
jgi:DNA-binding MurR/RpiR family transcriptional regulator